MELSKQLASRFREPFYGKWVAQTNFKDQLASLNWQEATYQSGKLNTIAALVFHVDYYVAGVYKVLKGGELEIRDQFSFDMPSISGEEGWKSLTNDLLHHATQFADHLETMTNAELNSVFVHEKYGTYHRNIDALIEHNYYHLGQVTLISKWVKDQ